jgi:excisionase family DNA binding protein
MRTGQQPPASSVVDRIAEGASSLSNYLGIRPWTLRHWVSDGKIEIVKYGNGIVRIRRSVLDRFVASCTIKARQGHGSNNRSKESRLLEGAGVGRGEESLAR